MHRTATLPAVRRQLLGASIAGVSLLALVACSDSDDVGSSGTLAAIATTTVVTTTLPPTTTQPRFYEVQPGDTLTEIAVAYGLPIAAIMEKNGIDNADQIYAGQILELPPAAEIVATSLPAVAAATTTLLGVPPVTTAAP